MSSVLIWCCLQTFDFLLDKLLKLFKVINSIHLIIYANELGFVFVLECTITDEWLNNQMWRTLKKVSSAGLTLSFLY